MPTEQETRNRGFTAGFAVACAVLAKDHGHDDLAALLINDAGITVRQMREAGVDPADIEILTSLISN